MNPEQAGHSPIYLMATETATEWRSWLQPPRWSLSAYSVGEGFAKNEAAPHLAKGSGYVMLLGAALRPEQHCSPASWLALGSDQATGALCIF